MGASANMKRYIAFLRGINISGKRKVPMAKLKKGFEEIGFTEVKTYLNSGNVIFSSNEDEETYDNLIFIMPPATFADALNEIGEPKEELEKIRDYKGAVFWSFSRKDYQKTNWWPKTASTNISSKLTIRTANTVRKTIRM